MSAFVTVFFGVFVAQAITFLLSPLLSRIYTPAEFGIYWTFVGIVSLLSVGITGRYEFAIGLPIRDEEASVLAGSALFLAVGLAIALPLGWNMTGVFAPALLQRPGLQQLGEYAIWIALGAALCGAYQILNVWLTRKALFRNLSVVKIIQASSTGLLALLLFGWGVSGWIAAYVFGFFGPCVWGYMNARQNGLSFVELSPGSAWKEMVRYRQFPLNALPAIMDSAANWFPVLFVSAVFQSDFVGQFTMARQMLGAPLALIGAAITPVMYQRLTTYSQQGVHLVPYLRIYAGVLMAIGLIAIPIITLWGGDLFAVVFGEVWREAGQISGTMIFAYAIRFVGSSLSISLVAVGAMRALSVWQIASFVVIAFICLLPYHSPLQFLRTYVVAEVAMYSLYVATSFWFAQQHDRTLPSGEADSPNSFGR